jgi:hypothetical protein
MKKKSTVTIEEIKEIMSKAGQHTPNLFRGSIVGLMSPSEAMKKAGPTRWKYITENFGLSCLIHLRKYAGLDIKFRIEKLSPDYSLYYGNSQVTLMPMDGSKETFTMDEMFLIRLPSANEKASDMIEVLRFINSRAAKARCELEKIESGVELEPKSYRELLVAVKQLKGV